MTQLDRRLRELTTRFGLPDGCESRLAALVELVAADPHAPTSVTDPARTVDAHVADSLVALELAAVRDAAAIADVGSGAGFPGLVLAVALPGARVVLVESAAPKCRFLARAVAAVGAANAEIAHARVEEWALDHRDSIDVVTARAVAPLAVLAEYAAPLLRPGGALVAWKGQAPPDEQAHAAAAAAQLGLEVEEVRAVQPFPAARDRHLHVLRKVAPTPERFPRRPGRAAKRPLGAD